MQFMLTSPAKAPAATFLMRFSWILISTREAGKFLGTVVSRFLEKYSFCICFRGTNVLGWTLEMWLFLRDRPWKKETESPNSRPDLCENISSILTVRKLERKIIKDFLWRHLLSMCWRELKQIQQQFIYSPSTRGLSLHLSMAGRWRQM